MPVPLARHDDAIFGSSSFFLLATQEEMGRNRRKNRNRGKRILNQLQLLHGVSESSKTVKKPSEGVVDFQHFRSRPREVIANAHETIQPRYAAETEPGPLLRHLSSQKNPLIRGPDKSVRRSVASDYVTEPGPLLKHLSSQKNRLIRGSDKSVRRCVALDCEMVGAGLRGSTSLLGRCSIVNHHGNVIYDTYVAPEMPVTDYRTPFSGIRRDDLEGAPSFSKVQSDVKKILKGRILVGHDLRHDFRVLNFFHPPEMIRDTSQYTFRPFGKNPKGKVSKLSTQVFDVAGVDIQQGEHSSVEDAQATMFLYQDSKEAWEQSLRATVRFH